VVQIVVQSGQLPDIVAIAQVFLSGRHHDVTLDYSIADTERLEIILHLLCLGSFRQLAQSSFSDCSRLQNPSRPNHSSYQKTTQPLHLRVTTIEHQLLSTFLTTVAHLTHDEFAAIICQTRPAQPFINSDNDNFATQG
jgi:hypothetical protein